MCCCIKICSVLSQMALLTVCGAHEGCTRWAITQASWANKSYMKISKRCVRNAKTQGVCNSGPASYNVGSGCIIPDTSDAFEECVGLQTVQGLSMNHARTMQGPCKHHASTMPALCQHHARALSLHVAYSVDMHRKNCGPCMQTMQGCCMDHARTMQGRNPLT